MIQSKIKSIISLLVMSALLTATGAGARTIELQVNLGTPVMEAGKIQKTFLKVGLRGFDLPIESDRASVNLAIVLDRSGSMAGEKLARAKEAAIMAIGLLNSRDIVSMVTYDSVVNVVVPATRVTDKQSIYSAIRNIRDGGRTALFAGVSKGAAEVRKFLDKTRVNRVILLSDGLANIGPSTPSELGQLGASLGKEGISVTTIGLGLGYNEDLMTQLAGMSDGHHAFVQNSADLSRIFAAEFNTALTVVANQLTIIIKCANTIRPIRVLGRSAQIIGQNVHVNLNQLSSNQEKFVILEVEIPAGVAGETRDLASVDVSYLDLRAKVTDSLHGSVSVNFSKKREDVVKSVNQPVMDSAAEQVLNQVSKEAVVLRDAGKLEAAKDYLRRNIDSLKKSMSSSGAASSPRFEALAEEVYQDADELGDNKKWNEKRKSMRQRQFKYDHQQKY
ncbi:MAG: VWA domain-containing protein [Nitrospina sp.]|nr:MAG: VWA domain-containing protein [Nitrospina sp.]